MEPSASIEPEPGGSPDPATEPDPDLLAELIDELHPGPPGSAATAAPRFARWAATWALIVAVFFVPSAVWALSSPIYSVPDEPQQVAKAVSIWYGQFSGEPVAGQPSVVRSYRLPALWATSSSTPGVCFAFHRDVTPDQCHDRLFTGGSSRVDVETYDGGFPPLYFALVGWAGRLWPGQSGVYAMRLVSALLTAILLASALLALRRVVRLPLVLVGLLAAATPMLWFLSGGVNPNGFEIAAAIALWGHVLAIVAWRERTRVAVPSSLVVGAVVCGGLLAFTRQLSPLYVGVIVGLGLLSGSFATMRSLGRDRSLRVALAVTALGSGVALVLVVAARSLGGLGGGAVAPDTNPWLYLLGRSRHYVDEMVAWFGWLDTPPAWGVVWAWVAVTVALVAAAIALGRRRALPALGLTVAITVALPVITQVGRPLDRLLTWQGRHGLPVAVGIALLAVVAIDGGVRRRAGLVSWLSVAGVAVLAVGNVAALWWNLHRYTLGWSAPGLDLAAGAWQPPLGAWTWVVVMAGFGALVTAWTAWAARAAHRVGRP